MSFTSINYQNGNCSVTLYSDGTKEREWEGVAAPEFPESVDLKITDYCDAGCSYCHEQSTKKGKHAPLQSILDVVDGLPRGAEIAIGGGNPLAHPYLDTILNEFASRGLIPNMTVNAVHIKEATPRLNDLRARGLLYGLGISYRAGMMDDARGAIDQNTIIHVIAGVHSVREVMDLPKEWPLLVLGYKQYGFGVKYYQIRPVSSLVAKWRYWIGTFMRNRHVCFDNLALEQLNIRARLTEEQWNRLYMGDDGRFTMYIDAVREEFASSSTKDRIPFSGRSIRDMFGSLQSPLTGGHLLSTHG